MIASKSDTLLYTRSNIVRIHCCLAATIFIDNGLIFLCFLMLLFRVYHLYNIFFMVCNDTQCQNQLKINRIWQTANWILLNGYKMEFPWILHAVCLSFAHWHSNCNSWSAKIERLAGGANENQPQIPCKIRFSHGNKDERIKYMAQLNGIDMTRAFNAI